MSTLTFVGIYLLGMVVAVILLVRNNNNTTLARFMQMIAWGLFSWGLVLLLIIVSIYQWWNDHKNDVLFR